jgi:23S rRNA pseudouridine1911/1915/1917 synthase
VARRRRRLDIVHEDSSLIVINKPPGLLTVPLKRREDASSVYDELVDYFRSKGKRTPLVVHRIDRDTSGLVMFAKDGRTQHVLKDQFERREPERYYLAVVAGHPAPPEGTWRDRLVWDADALEQREAESRDRQAAEAISEYRVLESFPAAALLEVQLRTGKRNQIRIQAGLRGHPLAGERQYVYEGAAAGWIDFPRQALHAWRLAFQHPVTGRAVHLEAPIPVDLSRLLEHLRKRTPPASRN